MVFRTRRPNRRRTRRPRRKGYRKLQLYRNKAPSSLRPGGPQFMKMNFRFVIDSGDSHAIASSSGSYIDYAYRATSPYDPYAESGHK